MRCTINAGAHFTSGWARVWNALPWVGQQTIRRRVTFDKSCIYHSSLYNSEDVNKLFGITFGWLPRRVNGKWVSPGHYDSARVGWLWSETGACWKLVAYTYSKGVKNWDDQLRYPEIARVADGTTVDCFINYGPASGIATFDVQLVLINDFVAIGSFRQMLTKNLSKFGFKMGTFFGGNLPAPHTMSIQLDKL